MSSNSLLSCAARHLALQVVQEVFCWSRNPVEVRRLCGRKQELYAGLLGNHYPPVVPGVPLFLDTLVKHNVRCIACHSRLALCSSDGLI